MSRITTPLRFVALRSLAEAPAVRALAALVALAVIATPAPGQETTSLAVATQDNVLVRCGAAKTFYPMAVLKAGDAVLVRGEKYGWARVLTAGPVFRESVGLVKYPVNDASRFAAAPDGRTGRARGPMPVIARNLDTTKLTQSWRQVCVIENGQTLDIIETITTEPNSEYSKAHIVHTVRLPEHAEGWVNTSFLRPATDTERRTWEAQRARDASGSTPVAAAPKPAPRGEPATTGTETLGDVQAISPPHRPAETPAATTDPVGMTTPDVTPIDDEEPAPATTAADPAMNEPTIDQVDPASPVAEEVSEALAAELLADELARAEMDDLEVIFLAVQALPVLEAELTPLRDRYLSFAEAHADDAPELAEFAAGRAVQLGVWERLQLQRQRISALREQVRVSSDDAAARLVVLANSGNYVVAGRLTLSTVFNGRQLPVLYRIQDRATGRTLIYLHPNADIDFTNMLGQHVGVRGVTSFDETLGVMTAEPSRIDLILDPVPAGGVR